MDIADYLRRMPIGTLVPAAWVAEQIEVGRTTEPVQAALAPTSPPVPEPTWRERIWTCPAETRLDLLELCEALGKPRSFVYRHTSRKTAEKKGYPVIPHRKLAGELFFAAGEVRTWIRKHEDIVAAAPMDAVPPPVRVIR